MMANEHVDSLTQNAAYLDALFEASRASDLRAAADYIDNTDKILYAEIEQTYTLRKRIEELERIEEAAMAWKAARDKRGQYMNECDALNAALEDGDE